MEDRLKGTRAPQPTEAEIRFGSWDIFKLIYAVNISQGGMTLELPWEPKIDSQVLIKLVLPSGSPITLEALVKSAHPVQNRSTASVARATPPNRFQASVRFQNLDAPKRAAIEQTIRSNSFGGALTPSGLTRRTDS